MGSFTEGQSLAIGCVLWHISSAQLLFLIQNVRQESHIFLGTYV